jgi:tubulin polyglutamylase TTLL9
MKNFKGHKFDLRIYVLVTSFNPLKVWLAREGFARLSGEQFSLERIDDTRVHLTNMSIQLKAKKSKFNTESMGKKKTNDDDNPPWIKFGRKWALCSLRQYLTVHHGDTVVNELLQNIAGLCKLKILKQFKYLYYNVDLKRYVAIFLL